MTDIAYQGPWDPNIDPALNVPQEVDWESGDSCAKLYERSRIKALADEREAVQKKTFKKWVNSHLSKVSCYIEDLFIDLGDGKMLLKLLELLSGERLPKPTRGKMRIHCLENVDKSLNFLSEQRVHLENMGAHDIVDGNTRLTLGLIWTIILRFQIQDIRVEEVDTSETKQAKDALLLWCQMKTAGYPNVNIRNFTTSWRDGLAFNAIIHKHCPELVDYVRMSRAAPSENLEHAFRIAEQLGLSRLLDVEDIDVEQPDEKSIITYVVTFYHLFSKLKADTVHSKRIGKVVNQALETESSMEHYDKLTSDLLKWIEETVLLLNDRTFANSLSGVQQQLAAFNTYRTIAKPSKFTEKGNLEVVLFTIQSKMRANNQIPYTPSEGRLISDINKAWGSLETAEHARELALRDELIRQEKLEQLASRFDRKAGMREAWLSENQRLVSQDNFGTDLPAIEAATKKHEAIETDILAYEERVNAVLLVAKELTREGYHDVQRIEVREANVLHLWDVLLSLLRNRRSRLEMTLQLYHVFQEMVYILDWIEEIKMRLRSTDYGKHLMGVEDLLQKHGLLEADIRVLGERMNQVIKQASTFIDSEYPAEFGDFRPAQPEEIEHRNAVLREAYQDLLAFSRQRRSGLLESRLLWQCLWEISEEGQWVREKTQLMSSPDLGHDLNSVHRLLNKHKALEEDLLNRRNVINTELDRGRKLIRAGNMGSTEIGERIERMESSLEELQRLSDDRKAKLDESVEYYQCLVDLDDVDSWMKDILHVFKDVDVGTSETTVQSLLRKHEEANRQMSDYRTVLEGLHQQVNDLKEDGVLDVGVVRSRLSSIAKRFKEIEELSNFRHQKLSDALAMYRVFSEAETVRTWINEREKLLFTLVPGEEIEELEVIRHRFDGFEKEMSNNAERVATVNILAERLISVEHPETAQILTKQDDLNKTWNSLADLVEERRSQLQSSYRYNQYLIECKQTAEWIREKARLVESTDELGDDLSGIMQLQRRMGGLERDMDAIKTKLERLDSESSDLQEQRPEEAAIVAEEKLQLTHLWEELTDMLKERHDRLTESSELQVFLQDLDHIHLWLSRMQTTVASEDIPKDLTEAEKSLVQHEELKEDIDSYEAEFTRLIEFGRKITEGETDAQYMFLSQRLNALEEGWKDLRQMWENRQNLLSQSLSYQIFLRDALQVDVLLSQQENFLTKEDIPITLESAQNMLRHHENFTSTLNTNDERIYAVSEFGQKLAERSHYATEKIQQKVQNLLERRDQNRRRSDDRYEMLKDQVLIRELSQDVDDLEEWVQEKMIVATDVSFRDEKNIARRYNKHLAFEGEVEANKERLQRVIQEAEQLQLERPTLADHIEPRIAEMKRQWNELENTTRIKGEKMIEANRAVIFKEGTSDVMTWLETIGESIIVTEEEVETLTDVNVKLKKVDDADREMEAKRRQIEYLKAHAEKLKKEHPDQADEIEETHTILEQRFTQLLQPMQDKKFKLAQKKRVHQFFRDVEDERLWVEEKIPLASSTAVGNSLLSVQQLLRRHRYLVNEVVNHKHRLEALSAEGGSMISEGHPQSAQFSEAISGLQECWASLERSMTERQAALLESESGQSWLVDAGEAEAWLGEQELFLMTEERIRDEQAAFNALKKHEQREKTIENYGDEIKALGERSRILMERAHEESDQIAMKQARVDKLYAGLLDLCSEKKHRLAEILKLNHLFKEIIDLETWITERTGVACSHDLGNDYEHCCLLRERFREFARDTEAIGTDRVRSANHLCDSLIDVGHTDSAEIAQWKDRINEAWADLLEMIDTRVQLLKAAWDLHKYISDCQDVLDRIAEKMTSIPTEVSRDAKSVAQQQRKHAGFEHDLVSLGSQVQWVIDTASHLLPAYAGAKELQICERRDHVISAWSRLKLAAEQRKHQLADAADLHRFFAMVRELMLWMEEVSREMTDKEKPRDVSGVELLMNSHRSLKAEMDAREENMSICINLGRTLLHRGHPQSDEVRKCLIQLVAGRVQLEAEWADRWDQLQLMLEVYQFARDAAVAESWLMTQESYLSNKDLGQSLDETLALLKKHLAFERSAATQEDRFQALSKLTTFELREQDRTPEMAEKRRMEKEALLEAAVKEFRKVATPPETPSGLEGEEFEGDETGAGEGLERGGLGAVDEAEEALMRIELREGALSRKHEWESRGKKASNRSWHELWLVLNPDKGALLVYKDARTAHERPEETYRREPGLPLQPGSVHVAPAPDYTKKANVLRLKVVSTGGEYLFQARSAEDMQEWVEALNRAFLTTSVGAEVGAGAEPGGDGSGGTPQTPSQPRSSTLPSIVAQLGPSTPGPSQQTTAAPSETVQQPAVSGAKRRFFTLVRKK